MISPTIALAISIVGILILLRLKLHPGFAIFAGSIIISLTVLPLQATPNLLWHSLWNYQTARLLVVIACALTLSSLMEIKGLLANLATALENINPKLAVHLIPAVIGFVPMPAGTLVSATASRESLGRLGVSPAQSTYINYYFRHLWEFSLPVYPSILMASVILSVPVPALIKTLFPITLITILIGAVISYRILKNAPKIKRAPVKNIVLKLLLASWPVILLVLTVLLGLDAIIAFPLVLILLMIQQKVKKGELGKALKFGLNPRILFMLYAIMLFRAIIESSNAAQSLLIDMQTIGVPVILLLVIMPFIIAFITGMSPAFVGIAFPLLFPFIVSGTEVNYFAIQLAYVSGMVGLQLSPLHLCLVLTSEYFKTKLGNVYRYIIPPYLLIEAIFLVVYFFLG